MAVIIDAIVQNFTLPATGGKDVSLADLRNRVVVIYFYPKDSTPGCTTEAQEFGALHTAFQQAGCVILGVSRDSLRSHENFKAKQGLPFNLLSDADGQLCAQFSVIKEKKMCGRLVHGIERSTFVIDGRGMLRREWRGVKARGHAQDVLDFVSTLAAT